MKDRNYACIGNQKHITVSAIYKKIGRPLTMMQIPYYKYYTTLM